MTSISTLPTSAPDALFEPALPPALRESALKRLSFVMRAIAVALLITEGLHWAQVYLGFDTASPATSIARCVILGPTIVCWRVLDNPRYRPAFRLGFARICLWFITLALAYMEWMSEPVGGGISAGVSRVCLVVTLAPVLITDSLRSNFFYSVALLMTLPVSYGLCQLTGHAGVPTPELVSSLSGDLVAVGAAWISAATVNQLREQLAGQYGSYRLVRKLSSGGFGDVWVAAHRHLRRHAAIKIIKTEVGDPIVMERFLREAATLSSLECAHTVRLFDYGSSEDGTLYLAMELLHGLNVEELVKRFGPQPESRVVGLLSQACLSLEEAHERGLIHRDIKPANLFVSQVGIEADFLKVLDFGLVKGVSDGPTNLTKVDQVVGTPDCMSPEQVSGLVLDGRSDLYSLGCVGYFLLTGTTVFPEESAVKIIMNHVAREPERPSKRLGRTLDSALEELILACLRKSPDERPATARALHDQLVCLPHWSRKEAQLWWDENRSSLPSESPQPAGKSTAPG